MNRYITKPTNDMYTENHFSFYVAYNNVSRFFADQKTPNWITERFGHIIENYLISKYVSNSRDGSAVSSSQRNERWGVAVAVALGAVALGVTETAVYLTVGSVVTCHGVQRTMALSAVVARLVPLLEQTHTVNKKIYLNS